MSEISVRAANFLKVFSMVMVVGSLVYMYGYSTDKVDFIYSDPDWFTDLTKTYFFYAGLGIFVLFNLIMHSMIYLYKNTQGLDPKSFLFRSKKQKRNVLLWLTYLLAGINFFLTTIVVFIALAKINEVSGQSALMYIPLAGFIFVFGIFIGLINAVIRK